MRLVDLDQIQGLVVDVLNGSISDQQAEECQGYKRTFLEINPFILSASDGLSKILLEAGLAPSVDFYPIQTAGIVFEGAPLLISRSKEQIMLDTSLSLSEKRQLMKLVRLDLAQIPDPHILLADYCRLSLGIDGASRIFAVVAYGVCRASSRREAESLSVAEAAAASRSYFASLQRLDGTAAWLYPVGGTNLIIQSLCRAAAVQGTVHLLDQHSLEICLDQEEESWRLSGLFDDKEWRVTADLVINNESLPIESARFTRTFLVLRKGRGLFGDSGCCYWTVPPKNPVEYCISILQVPIDDLLVLYGWAKHERATSEELQTCIKSLLLHEEARLILSASYSNYPTHEQHIRVNKVLAQV